MKIVALHFSLILLLSSVSSARLQIDSISADSTIDISQQTDSTINTITTQDTLPRILDRKIINTAFPVGEKLTFTVRYGFIKAGEATMSVEEIVPINNRSAYKFVTTARSGRSFDWIFKVRDQVQSWIDTEGLYSWKYIKSLREGGYKFDLIVDYDQYYGNARIQEIRYEDDEPLRIRDQKEFDLPIPKYVLDVLGSFYFVRTQPLRVGMPLYITNHDNAKVYDLKVIIQKRETIEVSAGKFRCLMVEPQLRGDAIFKQKGRLWVWLSDDEYKIPVQMKSAVFVGSITTELKKIEGLPLPLPSQIK
jgi:hypothetical protein